MRLSQAQRKRRRQSRRAGGPAPAQPPKPDADKPEAESYTSRLLKAKKQVWKDREIKTINERTVE